MVRAVRSRQMHGEVEDAILDLEQGRMDPEEEVVEIDFAVPMTVKTQHKESQLDCFVISPAKTIIACRLPYAKHENSEGRQRKDPHGVYALSDNEQVLWDCILHP